MPYQLPPESEWTVVERFCPPGVSEILNFTFGYFIGRCNDNTILKYLSKPHDPGQAQQQLEVEAQIYKILGHHERIIQFKGLDSDGLHLEYGVNGTVKQYLKEHNPTTSQRLKWCQQAAEGIAYIHFKSVLHCDIALRNMVLDEKLNIKIIDFQGRYLGPDGSILLNGNCCENTKSFMPRSDCNYADQKTDLFALASAMYHMTQGHEPFPDLDPYDDDDDREITARFVDGRFPPLASDIGGDIVHGCWAGRYESATNVVEELKRLQSNIK